MRADWIGMLRCGHSACSPFFSFASCISLHAQSRNCAAFVRAVVLTFVCAPAPTTARPIMNSLGLSLSKFGPVGVASNLGPAGAVVGRAR